MGLGFTLRHRIEATQVRLGSTFLGRLGMEIAPILNTVCVPSVSPTGRLELEYRSLVVDSAAGISTQTVAIAAAADVVLLVTTPDLTAMPGLDRNGGRPCSAHRLLARRRS